MVFSNMLMLGCEFIDVEYSPGDEDWNRRVDQIAESKGNSLIIGSFHDVTGKYNWTSPKSLEMAASKPGLIRSSFRHYEMTEVYREIHRYADVVKLISFASDFSSNHDLQTFQMLSVPSLGLDPIPLIALNMGISGQISRAYNSTLTPVTHDILPSAAAPGQLTVKQINQWKEISGLLPAKRMFLFGAPISHSPSPILHNAGFEALGLPHNYSLHETDCPEEVVAFVQEQVSRGDFGGASVTIPLKELLLQIDWLESVTPSAKAIGAINTIIPSRCNDTGMTLLTGDNTDWLGIQACIKKSSTTLPTQSMIGIVLGAGGTARAACYALGSLHCRQVQIWNRTHERAMLLALEFGSVWPETEFIPVSSPDDIFKTVDTKHLPIVVSTIPAAAQIALETDLDRMVNSRAAQCANGIFVELAYQPSVTKAMGMFAAKGWQLISGRNILLEQGLVQFEKWTKYRAPRYSMTAAVLD